MKKTDKPERKIMAEEWTEQDEATYRPLRRKLLRIEKRKRVDNQPGGRKHKYAPRGLTDRNKKAKEYE